MIEKIMKEVKRGNKKRSINITVGAVVGFLLSCTTVMGAALEIIGDGTDYKVTSVTIEGNTFEEKTYTNNGEIKDEKGINVTGTARDKTLNIVNNGNIETTEQGIYAQADIGGNIINNGTIKVTGTGSAIDIEEDMQGDIVNKGKISTPNQGIIIANDLKANHMQGNIINEGIIEAGENGINIGSSANVTGDISNKGVIESKGTSSNYGINVEGAFKGNVENNGTISSTAAAGTSNGINIEKTVGGDILNKGLITSTVSSGSNIAYGILNEGEISGKILNTGFINTETPASHATAIKSQDGKINEIINRGNLRSKGSSGARGIDMRITLSEEEGTILNEGLIRNNVTEDSTAIAAITVGRPDDGKTNVRLTNSGVVHGKNAVIMLDRPNANITEGLNYGILVNEKGDILVGREKAEINFSTDLDIPVSASVIANYGLAFTANEDGTYTMIETVGTEIKDEAGRTLLNAVQETNADGSGVIGTNSIEFSALTSGKSYVLNGIDKTLKVADEGKELNGSIINAYKTAVVLESGAGLSTENTIFNGGADWKSETIHLAGNNTLAVKGDSIINGDIKNTDSSGGTGVGGNKISIAGSTMNGNLDIAGDDNELNLNGSFMNGNIAATGDNNKLTLDESILNGNVAIDGTGNTVGISGENTYINGDLKAVTGKNTLNIGGKTTAGNSLNMFHEVSGFNEMNIVDGSVTFFEDAKVTGVENLTVAQDATLNLRLKKTGDTTESGLAEATHAFSANGEMTMKGLDDGGTLNFITNGIGEGVWIDTQNMQLQNMIIETSSVIDGFYKLEDNDGLVIKAEDSLGDMLASGTKVEDSLLRENIFNSENFNSINDIYKGIYSSNSSTGNNLDVLRDIAMIDRNTEEYNGSTSKPEQIKNIQAYLNEIYTQSPYAVSSELSRKSAGMFRDIVADNMFRPNLNQWLVMGGLTHIDGGTKDSYYGEVYKLDGKDSLSTDVDTKLTGAYALGKYGYSENVTLGVTVGGNRSEAELDRSKVKGNSGYIGAFAENYRGNLTLKAGAGVQYSEYDADRNTIGGYSYSDKYSDMTYDIYLNGRYSHNIGDNLFLEPYGTLSYTYVDQEGTDEGSKVLAIETDSKSFDYISAKVGVDLKKVIPHEKGKSTLSAGVSYTRLLSGADSDNLTGRFEGGSDFDILVASKNEHSLGLNAKYTLELENGVLFDVKGTYSVERDSYNDGNTRNRNKGEWIVGAGLGYKF